MTPDFLSFDDILAVHAIQVERFGGSSGIRDEGLLRSALGQPCATFDDGYLHSDLFEMAAAYLFHIVSNHPFVDGNKRTGLAAALVFLELNGEPINAGTERLYEITMATATGDVEKPEIAELFRSLTVA